MAKPCCYWSSCWARAICCWKRMRMNKAHVRIVDWVGTEALRTIRQQVFIDEQQVPPELAWDAEGAKATHYRLNSDQQPAGTARLLVDGHIGRVGLLPQARGQGLGCQLMLA